MAKSIFVTATGTDIGKTYVSGLIVKKMREFGLNCGYYKPVLSGAENINGELVPGDCKHVVDTAELKIKPLDCLSYCFLDAVSPHLAAERVNTVINLDKISSDYQKISKNYDYMLLEGAGGITCPMSANEKRVYLLWELIKKLEQNVIVVADGGLGTINSILTTVEYIRNKEIKINGIILNNYDKNNFMHRDNLEMVERLTGIKVIATVAKDDKDLDIKKEDLEEIFE